MGTKTETLYVRGVPAALMREVRDYAKTMTERGGRTGDAVCALLRQALDARQASSAKVRG